VSPGATSIVRNYTPRASDRRAGLRGVRALAPGTSSWCAAGFGRQRAEARNPAFASVIEDAAGHMADRVTRTTVRSSRTSLGDTKRSLQALTACCRLEHRRRTGVGLVSWRKRPWWKRPSASPPRRADRVEDSPLGEGCRERQPEGRGGAAENCTSPLTSTSSDAWTRGSPSRGLATAQQWLALSAALGTRPAQDRNCPPPRAAGHAR